MIIGLMIFLGVLAIVFWCVATTSFNHEDLFWVLFLLTSISVIVILVFGYFHGFINYPKTEGTHQGIITAVDLEGKYFRRYEVYLKSNGHTEENASDESKYLIYETEEGLAKQLKECIGKKVRLNYGHDGGYIPWNSCGTYHIKSVELVEE